MRTGAYRRKDGALITVMRKGDHYVYHWDHWRDDDWDRVDMKKIQHILKLWKCKHLGFDEYVKLLK